ncbi:MAG: endoglucanase, partial [Saccharothrix sp.]|nr:endoglucanase [Saccharothrix sp.]
MRQGKRVAAACALSGTLVAAAVGLVVGGGVTAQAADSAFYVDPSSSAARWVAA